MATLGQVNKRDVIANRPAFGMEGRMFYATDTGGAYRDNGSSGWDSVTGSITGGKFVKAQTGTSYTVDVGDLNSLITFSNSSAVAVDLPTTFLEGWFADFRNLGTGVVTITPTSPALVNGAATIVLHQNEGAELTFDATDYQLANHDIDALQVAPPKTRTISTTAPLTGGGDLSANRTLDISNFTGDSGSGGAKGTVPAPASGDAAAKKYLNADGTWSAIPESSVTSLVTDLAAKVPTSRTVSTTAPLTGGGDLSANRTLDISNFTGDSGSGGAKGTVPAPGAGDAAAGKFLKADGTFAVPAGSFSSPLTTKGDVHTYSSVDARLGVGSDGDLLSADSGETTGLKWISAIAESKVTGLVSDLAAKVPTSRTVSTTVPLTGGGDLSANRTLDISNFTGDSGSGGAKGTVPAPAAGDAAAGKFLKADGTFAVPAGTFTSPLTTKGDVYTHSTVDIRLAVGSDGQVLTADSAQTLGIKWATPTAVPSFADNETPAGTMDGSNQVFTLAHAPSPAGSLILVLNGLVQIAGTDFTLSSLTITYATSAPKTADGELQRAWYRY